MTSWGKLEELVAGWRAKNYESEFPLIAELLFQQRDESGQLTYLRDPQLKALETYWYLRLRLGTPKFLELYEQLYDKRSERFGALGVKIGQDYADFDSDEDYLRHVASTDHALAESLSLDYPSYIMALTMGAGKTVLIGAIIATEFAMSLEYNDDKFMKNALVFAPGTTIIESLKEISVIPYEKILSPHAAKAFMANVKLVYAQAGDKDIQAQAGSSYNIIVTNTEKIALRARTVRRGQTQFDFENQQKQDRIIDNLRLQKIASLPCLGIFSDEAHHTYGNKLGDDLKRVRETINHLHNETNLICVVNTTGTPYSGSQTLKDVVFWYGLDQGIKDNVLKSLNGSIVAYDFGSTPPDEVFTEVIADFFTKYKDTRLITGQHAKIAFYFKSQEHLDESRGVIEKALASIGESPSLILMNTQLSSKKEVDEFNRLNDPTVTKRVILLVSKGTEGWNCPSLFATALIRELTVSNNFILQASTRCLRQVEGNTQPATIYLESHNQSILNDELQKTYGTTLHELNNTEPLTEEVNAVFLKTESEYPKLEITRTYPRIVAGKHSQADIQLAKPEETDQAVITREIFTPISEQSGVVLSNTGEEATVVIRTDTYDLFTAAQQIAANYHLKISKLYQKLAALYVDEVPRTHLRRLFEQVEQQTSTYEVVEEQVTEALALIKFIDDNGDPTFKKSDGAYYHTIRYSPSKKNLVQYKQKYEARNANNWAFHYNPYKFDSAPEEDFLRQILERLQIKAKDIYDIYFTGGITTSLQTDLHFEYKDKSGRYRDYYPDFVIVKRDGSFLIVEIKAEGEEDDADVLAKQMAVERLAKIPANKFKYEILYTGAPIPNSEIKKVTDKLEKL